MSNRICTKNGNKIRQDIAHVFLAANGRA